MIRYLLTTLFFFLTFLSKAQEISDTIVNLQEKIKSTKNRNEKIQSILSLAELQYDRDFAMSKELLVDAFGLIGEKKDSVSQKQLAHAYVINGVIKRREGLYPEAIQSYLKAKNIYDNFKDRWNTSDVLHNMAMVYRYQKENRRAIDLYKKSIAVKELLNDTHGIAAGYNMMGVSYRQSKQQDSALIAYKKAKELFTSINSVDDVQRVNNNLVNLYMDMKAYDKALTIIQYNLNYAKKQNKQSSLCTTYRNASSVYKKTKEYKKSLVYIDSSIAIAKKEKFRQLLSKGYLRKSFLNSKLGDYKAAYENYRIFNRYSDSIFNIENIKKIQALELNNEFNQEKKEIELKTEVATAKKKLYQILLLITIVGAIVIGILFYLNTKSRSRALQEKLAKERAQKELLDQKIKVSEENTKRLIADNTMRLEFKEELIERIRKEIVPEATGKLKTAINSMMSELQLQVATEGKLSEVQSKINEVNKGFDAKLRELYPTLTKSEREICTLLRLNLSIKEIMTVRNASLDSVKSTRYRIRKKMKLTPKEELERFIQSI